MKTLTRRVALVTGASGGIGGAIVRGLAAEGATVALAYGEHAEPAEKLAEELVAAGGLAVAIAADLSRTDGPDELVDAVDSQLGAVEVLVAAAGSGKRQTLEEVSLDDFDEMIAVNLRAPFRLAQRTAPGMRERGFGRVLFFSSVAAFTGGVVGPHYAASKSGLHGLTHFLAARLASSGVTVNALAPALMHRDPDAPRRPRGAAARVPVGRLGQAEEVARPWRSRMLRNPYMTNQVVLLDGADYPR